MCTSEKNSQTQSSKTPTRFPGTSFRLYGCLRPSLISPLAAEATYSLSDGTSQRVRLITRKRHAGPERDWSAGITKAERATQRVPSSLGTLAIG